MFINSVNEISDLKLYMNGVEIERVTEMRYLGVILDEKLSMYPHVNDLCSKLNKKFYILKRCGRKLTCYSRICYYNSIVLPSIDYCSTVLISLNEQQIRKLQLIQNRFMRLILKMNKYTHVSFMLDMLMWQSIKQRIYLNSIKFIHRVVNGKCPSYLSTFISLKSEMHNHDTRGKDQLNVKTVSKTSTHNSLFHKGLNLYNKVLEAHRIATVNGDRTSLNKFFKVYVLSNY